MAERIEEVGQSGNSALREQILLLGTAVLHKRIGNVLDRLAKSVGLVEKKEYETLVRRWRKKGLERMLEVVFGQAESVDITWVSGPANNSSLVNKLGIWGHPGIPVAPVQGSEGHVSRSRIYPTTIIGVFLRTDYRIFKGRGCNDTLTTVMFTTPEWVEAQRQPTSPIDELYL